MLHYICSHQVQDYYLMLKFNNGDKCHKALYSLFIACCMLHNNRPTGNKSAYNYPKVILSFMLILQHWKQTNYCGYEMMKKCMAIFNEELGELTFSILARSTLGDHCKNNFEHMDRLFKLLPVYRDMKRDVVQDSGRADSLSWRHKIKVDSDEVRSCELFLKQMIRELRDSSYKSYDGSKTGYTNSILAAAHKVKPSNPLVYMTKEDLDKYVSHTVDTVRADMNTNFLYRYRHIWPECVNTDLEHLGEEQIVSLINEHEEKVVNEIVDDDNGQKLADDGETDNEEPAEEEEDEGEEEDDDVIEEDQVDEDDMHDNPYETRDWSAWGRVNAQNQMIGKRRRKQVERFQYVGRRKGAQWPDPSLRKE